MTDYPPYRALGDRPRSYLLDVAHAAAGDPYPLSGDRGLIEDVCRELIEPSDPFAAMLDAFRLLGANSVTVTRVTSGRLMITLSCANDDTARSVARSLGTGPVVRVTGADHEWIQGERRDAETSVAVSGPMRAVVERAA